MEAGRRTLPIAQASEVGGKVSERENGCKWVLGRDELVDKGGRIFMYLRWSKGGQSGSGHDLCLLFTQRSVREN